MGRYEWRGPGAFIDGRNNREIEPGEIVEIDDSLVGPHAFVEVEEPEDDADPEGSDTEDVCADENCSRTVTEDTYCWQHSGE